MSTYIIPGWSGWNVSLPNVASNTAGSAAGIPASTTSTWANVQSNMVSAAPRMITGTNSSMSLSGVMPLLLIGGLLAWMMAKK